MTDALRPDNAQLRRWNADPQNEQCWGLDGVADYIERLERELAEAKHSLACARQDVTAHREAHQQAARERDAKFWECPECMFKFDAFHKNQDGTYSCPVCELAKLSATCQIEGCQAFRTPYAVALEAELRFQRANLPPRQWATIDAALAKNPNPSGQFLAEASGSITPEASGPVGLGPLLDKIESYPFECEAGPLTMCVDWIALRAALQTPVGVALDKSQPMDNRLIVALEILGEYACELQETNGIERATEVRAAMVALGAVSTLPEGPAPIVRDAERYGWLVTNCHLGEAPENFGRYTYDKAWIDGRVDACQKRHEDGEVGRSPSAEKVGVEYKIFHGVLNPGPSDEAALRAKGEYRDTVAIEPVHGEGVLLLALREARGWLDDTLDNPALQATIARVDAALRAIEGGALETSRCTLCDPRPEATDAECDKWPGHFKGCLFRAGEPTNGWQCDGKGNLTRPRCAHEWVSARNEVITSGEICPKCKAIRAESATDTAPKGGA